MSCTLKATQPQTTSGASSDSSSAFSYRESGLFHEYTELDTDHAHVRASLCGRIGLISRGEETWAIHCLKHARLGGNNVTDRNLKCIVDISSSARCALPESELLSTTMSAEETLLALQSMVTFENAKTALFFYVILSYLLQAYRHLRANGFRRTIYEGWVWVQKVRVEGTRRARVHATKHIPWQQVIFLLLRFPAGRQKVEAEMGKARESIEDGLIPKGPDVVRHLVLPAQGRPLEWIEQEMASMDGELTGGADWRQGKLSGAVYREHI